MTVEPLTIPEPVRDEIVLMAKRGDSIESMIGTMRERGLEKVKSIRLLSDVAHLSLGEAKEKIHFSPVWADRRAADDAVHEAAYQALLEDGWVEDDVDEPGKFSISTSLTTNRP